MSYDNTKGLIKLSNGKLPLNYIALESYAITPNQVMDLDSGRNAYGVLVRNVLSHTATKIEVKTPYLHEAEKVSLMTTLSGAYSDSASRTLTIEYYDTTTSSYKSGTFYMPDIKFEIYNIDETSGDIVYKPISLTFIEY